MADSAINQNTLENHLPQLATPLHDASHALQEDQMSLLTQAGRVGQVTVEGLAKAPMGAVHALEHDLAPSNWVETGEKLAGAAATGAVLRAVLPESGALKTAAGLAMGFYFAKDGLAPVVQGWKTVTSDSSAQAMENASTKMGEGLGAFGVDGYVSMKVANFAGEKTADLAGKYAPKQWNAIENFKNEHLSGTSPLMAPLTNFSSSFKDSIKNVANKLDPRPEPMSPEQIREAGLSTLVKQTAYQASETMFRHGVAGSDGNTHGLDRTVSLLLAGEDPNLIKAGPGPIDALKSHETIADRNFAAIGDGVQVPETFGPQTKLTVEPLDLNARKGPKAGEQADSTDKATTPVDATRTDAAQYMTPETMDSMAGAIRAHLGGLPDESGLVLDQINRTVTAVDAATNPAFQRLQGYDDARGAMINLAHEVGGDPRQFAQVGDLFHRFADAATQSGSNETQPVGNWVKHFNNYSAENLETYRRNIIAAGIDPKIALLRKPNAPLGEATSDVEPIGVDKNGKTVYAHQGPHTVRGIYGPNGEGIWPIDLVKLPVREAPLRAVLTSGIDGHELMHDQFGNMGEFDPETRATKLETAAKKVLGDQSDAPANVPNAGLAPQDVLLNNVARQAAKIEAKPDPEMVQGGVSAEMQKEAFLENALQRTQQGKVMAAANAADALLGDAGKTPINVPGTGRMPLLLFVANVAAMADDRLPSDVLKEAQAHQEAPTTRAAVEANVDKLLGSSANVKVPTADGSRVSLKDVVMKASDESRMPHFRTYDEPIPTGQTMTDVLVANAKAIPDEFFADLGAAAESGQTAAPYFQALRANGKLSSSSVMGQEMRSPDNPYGQEGHPVDEMRPYIQAAYVRLAATVNGQHDDKLLAWADALEKYADARGTGGDITYASLDKPGEAVRIPRDTYIKFMQELVDSQVHTPLPKLQGHSLFEILPDLRKNFRINEDLSNQWVDAMEKGQGPESLPFNKDLTKSTHVYGAGMPTFLQYMAKHPDADPIQVLENVTKFSDYFQDKYIGDNPHASTNFTKQFKINPMQTLRAIPTGLTSQIGQGVRSVPRYTDAVSNYSTPLTNVGGSLLFQDLTGLRQTEQDMLKQSN